MGAAHFLQNSKRWYEGDMSTVVRSSATGFLHASHLWMTAMEILYVGGCCVQGYLTEIEKEVHGYWMRSGSRILYEARSAERAVERFSMSLLRWMWWCRWGIVVGGWASAGGLKGFRWRDA